MDQSSPTKPDISTEFSPLTPSTDTSNDQKRRSSSRSIKRKRFDDEIVQYSLGIPPAQVNRIGRSRRQSVAAPNTPTTVTTPTQVLKTPEPTLPITSTPQPTVNAESPTREPIKSEPTLQTTTVPVTVNSTPISTPIVQIPMIPQPPALTSATVPPAVPTPAPLPEKRRAVKSISSSKKNKKHRPGQQTTTKDLGRWKPIDDLSLIIGIQQTNDLRVVHQGVKFSCKFTIQEMQNRWYSLLYDEPISRIVVAAMRNLHPEIVDKVCLQMCKMVVIHLSALI